MQCVFLVVVVGGSILFYSFLGPYFYRNHRISVLKNAFESVKDIDLSDIGEDISIFREYEGNSFKFIIADENMQSVYTTDLYAENTIYKNIQLRKEAYGEIPAVIRRNGRWSENIRIYGIIPQGEHIYYVCIKDKMNSVDSPFQFSVYILGAVVALSIIIGSVVMYCMSNRLASPINELEMVAQKLAARDFSQRAEENGKFEELNHLAASINSMAEQIQEYVEGMEDSKQKMIRQHMQQERMNKARKDFVSNVSHELKTPLAVISSQVEMLQYLKDDVRKEYYYTSIQEEVAKMSEMVGNLLNMSVMEYNMGKTQKKRISLNEIMEYILLKYDALFQRKGLQVEAELSDACVTFGDREYIEQAINNFVMNALQHTEYGKKIRIIMEKDLENVIIKVYNQGEVIQAKDIDRIWESFYMSEQNEEKEEENNLEHTGLGLYIVKMVMEMHGGTYGVENVEDGVEFWFSVPLMKEKSGA